MIGVESDLCATVACSATAPQLLHNCTYDCTYVCTYDLPHFFARVFKHIYFI